LNLSPLYRKKKKCYEIKNLGGIMIMRGIAVVKGNNDDEEEE